jgi:hypothetical protein
LPNDFFQYCLVEDYFVMNTARIVKRQGGTEWNTGVLKCWSDASI